MNEEGRSGRDSTVAVPWFKKKAPEEDDDSLFRNTTPKAPASK